MKKNYLFLAAAATMFTACVQSDLVSEIPEAAPQAISFETFANKQTRAGDTPAAPTAENSGAAYSQDLGSHHETFEVYAYKNVSDLKVFNDKEVSMKSEPVIENGTVTKASAWGYEGQVYWDKAATDYYFYAAAPAADYWKFNEVETNDEVDQSKSYFTIESHTISTHNAATYQLATLPTQSFKGKNVIDLMIAAENHLNKAVGVVPSNPVDLQFIHILSRLNVNVKATIDNVTVTNITVGNINSTGSFDENETLSNGTTLAGGTHQRWTLVEGVTSDDGSTITTSAPVVSYTNSTSKLLTKDANLIAIEALVIPQLAKLETVDLNTAADGFTQTKEPYLYIAYKINNEEYTQAFNLAAAFGAKDDDNDDTTNEYQTVPFNEGWQNTLNITISPETITFTADAAVWDENGSGADKTIE